MTVLDMLMLRLLLGRRQLYALPFISLDGAFIRVIFAQRFVVESGRAVCVEQRALSQPKVRLQDEPDDMKLEGETFHQFGCMEYSTSNSSVAFFLDTEDEHTRTFDEQSIRRKSAKRQRQQLNAPSFHLSRHHHYPFVHGIRLPILRP
ncbi:hypothetical protein PV08_09765 [Exophiala spinifera]|uniref:Uncharacterized protein n=1 Tax=Exophiala spinifera TaxID=91928 RepID=A0A0D2B0Q5_9EURO|nr:uncharacterized protein PV08_09765 [Exophiala spinifera]KIW12488.1 hypothetical protein PV08_09765 [Exophiala spinifera]